MSHSAAIENQNIESSDIKKKKRKCLFSCLAMSIALAGAGSFAWWEFVGSRYVETDNAYTWNGSAWETDKDAQNAATIATAQLTRSALLTTANAEISWRQDAVDAGIATAGETAALAEWKKYRVLLMRVDTSKAPVIEWPTQPYAQAS
ncbi:tail fiber assembly protein [Enterobacter roggenkampii]|uniref:tail fiber assembly protein n=1 Tax=Enterobacter roggenkampii TaxID=1812935 RepID=UPI00321A5572